MSSERATTLLEASAEDLAEPTPGRRAPGTRGPAAGDRRVLGARVAVVTLAVAAALVSVTVSRLVFPHFSTNNDEPVYVMQARVLLDHRLTLPATADTPFFRPWMSGAVGNHLVLVFPPVLPALLAAGQALLGSMRATLALLAGAGVLLVAGLTGAVTGRRRAAVIAAAILASCPLFIVQSGMFLSYVLALDLELVVALAVLRGVAVGRRRWFVIAGGALGLLFFARPFDALLTGVPLVLLALGVGGRNGWGRRALWRSAALAAGAAPFVAASLAYNAEVTGSAFRLPLDAIGGHNAAGFGLRQLTTGSPYVRYGWPQAVHATLRNLGSLAGWVPGGLLLMALAAYGLFRHRREAWAWAVTAFAVTVPVGYLFYWGNLLIVNGRRAIGPHYYLALLVPLVVLGASGLDALSRRWRAAGGIALSLLVVMAVVSLVPRLRLDRRQVALHNRERSIVDGARLANAIVFVPAEAPDGAWLGHPRPSFLNDPGLHQSVLFATDHDGENFDLAGHYPSRSLFRQLSRVPPDDRRARPVAVPVLWRLQARRGAVVHLHLHLVNRGDAPVVTAYLDDGTRGYRYCLDRSSQRGRAYDVDWTLSPGGVSLDATGAPAGAAAVADDSPLAGHPRGMLTVGATLGSSTSLATADRLEARYWLRRREAGVDVMEPGEQWQLTRSRSSLWLGQDAPDRLTVDLRTG